MKIKAAETRRERQGDFIYKYVVTPPLLVVSIMGMALVYAFPLWLLWSVSTFTLDLVIPENTEATK